MIGIEFARLIPLGPLAETALNSVIEDEYLSNHHRSFIHIRPHGTSSEAYYSLTLRDSVTRPFSTGWKVGRGVSLDQTESKGVNLLLICPGKDSHSVAPVHARIAFQPQSGALMLYGVQDDLPVRYDDPNSAGPTYLRSGDSRVMYAKSNLFSVGGLQYRLVFAPFNRQQYLNFVQQRNHMMQTCGLKAPHHALSAVNRREDTRRGLVVTHGTMGRGGYGWIYSGVDVVTGRPLAIKEHKAIKASYMEPITNEVNLGRMFNTHGLLPIFNDWCEHRLDDVCNKFPQAVYTSSPLAICDFWKVEWVKANVRDAIQAFHGPLPGLATLHAHGFIHRDVHRGNLFLMSVHPPVSLLGDFGKVIKAEVHQDSNLGPRDTRAPEVDGRTWYTNKIDIWSMGYAMVMCIALPSFPYPQPFDLQVWHREAMDFLDSDIDPSDDDKKAMDLIRCMLAWDPSERISAAEALRHDAFLARLPSPTPASAPQHFQTGNLQSLHAQPPPPQSHPSEYPPHVPPRPPLQYPAQQPSHEQPHPTHRPAYNPSQGHPRLPTQPQPFHQASQRQPYAASQRSIHPTAQRHPPSSGHHGPPQQSFRQTHPSSSEPTTTSPTSSESGTGASMLAFQQRYAAELWRTRGNYRPS